VDTAQAANATTIAAVGKRLGLPDHGVTVALAAALQESDLRNLDHGDLDSLGLFQQRPSEGWGSAAQIMNPEYAVTAFYRRLERVSGWETLSVAEAAQAVQHSAAPDAYAQFDQTARTLASALTGEGPAAFTCHYPGVATVAPSTPVRAALETEFGTPTLDTPLTASQGWTVCGWLVAHASQYAIQSVTFSGQGWSAQTGRWQPAAAASLQVRVHTATGA
jgi:hypothetical protein